MLDDNLIGEIAHVFQDRITDALVQKTKILIESTQPKTLGIVWWVSANTVLREKMKDLTSRTEWETSVYTPAQMCYCTDNAAMIGVVWLLESM